MYIGLYVKYPLFIIIIIIIIIIIFFFLFFSIAIIRHELGLDIPVSASSNSLFQGLSSRLRPFDP
jgi:hypothetical protein